MLKYTEGTIFCVEYMDLEKFILEETGHEYELLPNEEFRNDSVYRYRIGPSNSPDWERFKTTGEQVPFLLRDILKGLCSEGKVPIGNYLICVCW